jgi:hypothetical protein
MEKQRREFRKPILSMDYIYFIGTTLPGIVILFKFGLDPELLPVVFTNIVVSLGYLAYIQWRRSVFFEVFHQGEILRAKIAKGSDSKNFFLEFLYEGEEFRSYRQREFFENRAFNPVPDTTLNVIFHPKHPKFQVIPPISPYQVIEPSSEQVEQEAH